MDRRTTMLVLLLAGVLHSASSYCCSKKAPNIASHIAVCQDCTITEWCCAHGPCNIFCCNCDNGCRGGTCWSEHPRGKRDLVQMVTPNGNYTFMADSKSGYTIIIEGDSNGDGLLSLDEAHEMLLQRGAPTTHYRGKRDLQALDLDGDNYLSPLEIDRDADFQDDVV